MTKPTLVSLRWTDAHGTATNTYELHELPHKALEIVTYGLLLRDDADGVSIAAEDCGGGCYRGVTFVPAALIVEIKPLKRSAKLRFQDVAKASGAGKGVSLSGPEKRCTDSTKARGRVRSCGSGQPVGVDSEPDPENSRT